MPELLPTITTAQVAQLLGIAKSTFQDNICGLRRHHQFPAAIPGSGGRRYSRAAIVAWIDGARPPLTTPALEQDVTQCEAILLERARAKLAAD